MRLPRLIPLSCLAASLLLSLSAHAHGIWFAQRADEVALIYGHGAEDSSMVKRRDKVSSFAAYDTDGTALPASLKTTDYLLLVAAETRPSIFTATLDNGLWTQNAEGKWIGKGKDEVPGARTSGRYLKYVVSYREVPVEKVPLLPNQTLQIQPLTHPFPIQANKPLKLRVMFQGKPVAGAKVMHDYINDPDGKPVLTGKDGSVTLRVRNQSLNVIAASWESAPEDASKADKTGHFATFSFVLPHKEE